MAILIMNACVYLITCLITGKQYVGQTRKVGRNRKYYYGSGKLLKLKIKKYGTKNFKKQILLDNIRCGTALNLYEMFYIKKHNTLYPNGYNLDLGGTGRDSHCDATKQKIGNALRNRPQKERDIKNRVATRRERGSYVAWNKGKKKTQPANSGSFQKGKIAKNIQFIMNSLKEGKSQHEIAKELGVTQPGICQALNQNKLYQNAFII